MPWTPDVIKSKDADWDCQRALDSLDYPAWNPSMPMESQLEPVPIITSGTNCRTLDKKNIDYKMLEPPADTLFTHGSKIYTTDNLLENPDAVPADLQPILPYSKSDGDISWDYNRLYSARVQNPVKDDWGATVNSGKSVAKSYKYPYLVDLGKYSQLGSTALGGAIVNAFVQSAIVPPHMMLDLFQFPEYGVGKIRNSDGVIRDYNGNFKDGVVVRLNGVLGNDVVSSKDRSYTMNLGALKFSVPKPFINDIVRDYAGLNAKSFAIIRKMPWSLFLFRCANASDGYGPAVCKNYTSYLFGKRSTDADAFMKSYCSQKVGSDYKYDKNNTYCGMLRGTPKYTALEYNTNPSAEFLSCVASADESLSPREKAKLCESKLKPTSSTTTTSTSTSSGGSGSGSDTPKPPDESSNVWIWFLIIIFVVFAVLVIIGTVAYIALR